MYDLIIKNGTIIDGSGNERFTGDVAVSNGKIEAVGTITGAAKREIDATGKLVTPGWVDIHTHYDGQATWDPIMAPSSWHGVTTVIMGNCGVGFAPVRPGDQQFLIELMEGVEDIPGAALAEGIEWDWESFPEYLDALEKLPRTIDIGTQVPHGAIRAYVMGEKCSGDNDPTSEQLKEMVQLVREGIEAGALGFSTSRTLLHKDVHGDYVPGTFAGSGEMLQLGLAMKGLDHGIFEMVSDNLGDDDEWQWVKDFAEQTGRPVTLIATTPAAYIDNKMYRMVEEARETGMNIMPQMAGRPTGILHGLQSNFHVFVGHPTFREKLVDLPLEEMVATMKQPEVREALLSEQSRFSQGNMGDLDKYLGMVFPLGDVPDYEPDFEDSVAGIAQSKGSTPVEVMYDLLVGNDGKELFYQPLGGYHNYHLDAQHRMMQHPNVLMGLSDGGAHCGVIADAGMASFIMTHWGRDRKKGELLPLEFIVRSMTRRTAEAYGLEDRGLLQDGMIADINVIDFDNLQLQRPEAVFDLPTGGKRLVQRVDGYDYTIKSGEVTFAQGEPTGARPGGLVRG